MSNFKRLEIVFYLKRFRKPKSRENEYRICKGIIQNQITFGLDRIRYFVEWENEKESGQGWTDGKYLFKNLEEAKEEMDKKNKILAIDRKAREEKSKI